jgi:hypothetical protein
MNNINLKNESAAKFIELQLNNDLLFHSFYVEGRNKIKVNRNLDMFY